MLVIFMKRDVRKLSLKFIGGCLDNSGGQCTALFYRIRSMGQSRVLFRTGCVKHLRAHVQLGVRARVLFLGLLARILFSL